MLYTIFLYETQSGQILYEKSFQEISSEKIERFSSFFSAMKSFISELVIDGAKELRNIELGDYIILINTINAIKIDLVLIADKEDQKAIDKLIPKIIKVLTKHQQLFIIREGNKDRFEALNQAISELLADKTALIQKRTSLIETPEQILKSMWAHKVQVKGKTPEQEGDYFKEKNDLLENFNNTTNLINKLAVAEKILKVSEMLKDEKLFMEYIEKVKNVKDEIKDTKIKLSYFLNKTKTSLAEAFDRLGNKRIQEGDFKEAYINLYSFSTKLKMLTSKQNWEVYRDLAKKLIDKEKVSEQELSENISSILRMNDNIEIYLN